MQNFALLRRVEPDPYAGAAEAGSFSNNRRMADGCGVHHVGRQLPVILCERGIAPSKLPPEHTGCVCHRLGQAVKPLAGGG